MKVITVRNVPEDLYRSLVRQAERHRRSLQQQILLLLERARALDQEPPLERAAGIRARLQGRMLGDTVTEIREEREQ